MFIKDNDETLESKLNLINLLSKKVSNARIEGQYVVVYFLNEFSPEDIKRNYYDNYEYPDDYFANLETCTSSAIITIEKGIVIESDQEILNMLGE